MTGDSPRRGEFELIAALLAPLAGSDARALGLVDDAALLPQTSGLDTVVTTDTLVAGVHFLNTEPPEIIARRLLRVNLSDIAAMAALPVGYFLNLTLSPEIEDRWLEAFTAGLAADQKIFGITLFGGDTTRTPGPLTLTATLIGEAPSSRSVRRSTARDGDLVFVSGTIGDAGLGLARLKEGASPDDFLVERYQLPEPRLALGRALCEVASAMADVSDGLVADLGHICEASGIGAAIRADAVPLSAQVRRSLETGDTAVASLLTAGDDYELVFTVPPDRVEIAWAAADSTGVPITKIGNITGEAGKVTVRDDSGVDITPEIAGFRHF